MRAFGWATCLALGLGGCGTETGNPEGMQLSFNARSTSSEVSLEDPGATLLVDAVWLRLDAAFIDGCAPGEQAAAPAIGFADHGGVDAASQEVDLGFGTVCGLSVNLVTAPMPDPAEPEAFAGTSVGIGGVLSDGRDVEIALFADAALSLELDNEPLPTRGAWLLTFDVSTWVDAPELLSIEEDGSGVVRVDDERNPAVLAEFAARLGEGTRLHHDANGNGRVDDGERRLDAR